MTYLLRLAMLGMLGLTASFVANVSTATPASACLVEADGDPWDCGALYCSQDGNYPDDATKTCLMRGFMGTHKQRTSTAGDCPTCTVTIVHPIQVDVFLLVANNGWVATMNYDNAKRSSASGQGVWGNAPFPQFAGKQFTVNLKKSGTGKAFDMTIMTEGEFTMKATFGMGKRPSRAEAGL